MSALRLTTLIACFSSAWAFADDPAPTPAAPPPPADEIKRVLEYQDSGKERGPALLDIVPCLKVDTTKGSPTAFTCVEPVSGPVKAPTTVHAWVQFFCPKGGKYEDLRFKWILGTEVYETQDFTVEGLARTRTWRPLTVKKPGKWTIKILRGEEGKELGSASFTVVP